MTISGKAKVAGVIGWPVAHSLSPRLHGYWLAEHGIDGAYVPLPVRPEHVAEAIRALSKLGFVGANITVPHKEAALATADKCDPQARRVGAANTLVISADGAIEARNTDAFGFVENLREQATTWRANAGAAVVIGAGGSARAVVVALLDAGVAEVRVSNRTRARAESLAATLGTDVCAVPWADRHRALRGAALVVNATTLGMNGHAPLDLDLTELPRSAAVADLVYVPLRTPLLEAAAARGHTVVDGLGMLLHQARPAFEAWFGILPRVTLALREHVCAGLAN